MLAGSGCCSRLVRLAILRGEPVLRVAMATRMEVEAAGFGVKSCQLIRLILILLLSSFEEWRLSRLLSPSHLNRGTRLTREDDQTH